MLEATNNHHLMIIDPDPVSRAALAEQFVLTSGFSVTDCATPGEAREHIAPDHVDTIVENSDLVDASITLCAEAVRREGFSAPLTVLVRKDISPEGMEALDAWADDCILKPVRFAFLLSRIVVQIRQYETSDDTSFAVGPYEFRPGIKLLISEDGERLRLTEKETAILRFLYRASPAHVAREVLLSEVWGYNPLVTTHTLETHIYRLRQKIERDPANARILVTEPGGYRLVI
jgi:DNA-binding response OmpR family regulator